jgi:malate synthase
MAAFQMDEILYELRKYSAGLNCGRWDYIFSFIKKFKNNPDRVLPDRDEVGMTKPFMDAYVRLLIKTCHRRGVHAMGGMAAQIPIKNDAKANAIAMDKVAADKKREVLAGHDGTWVAHPALIPIAQKVFDQHMKGPNQLNVLRNDVNVKASDLLATGGKGSITEKGLRMNVDVGLRYTEAWLRGVGCVPIHNKMEDAATAEISRSQIWHWLKHKCSLNNGQPVTKTLVQSILNDEIRKVKAEMGDKYSSTNFELAKKIYADLMFSDDLADFLTLEAYPHIVKLKKLQSAL